MNRSDSVNSNSGNYNSGHWNSGDYNSGDCNSGNSNSGDCSSGDCNSGNSNSGHCNSGYWNSGHCNSGDCNSGRWNSTDHESGIFCTIEGTVRCFNKPSDKKWGEIDFPSFDGFNLTEWVPFDKMSDDEKKENPNADSTNGYLKVLEYEEAWKNFWHSTTEENRQKFLNLPNFDAYIFYEITGIKFDNKEKLSNKCESCGPQIGGMEEFPARNYIRKSPEILGFTNKEKIINKCESCGIQINDILVNEQVTEIGIICPDCAAIFIVRDAKNRANAIRALARDI